MFKILLHHLFGDVAGAPCPVADGPEVSPPVSFPQLRVFLLQDAGRAPFHPFDQIRECFRWWILNVHVDMIFAHHSFEYPDIFGITDLNQQVSTSDFDVACQHMVAILGRPD